MESIVVTLLCIALLGFLVHLITKIPMAEPFKELIVVATIVVVVLWLLAVLFGHAPLPNIPRFN